ncbi:post-GPI attachment to proteins factor 3, partial [Phtheirospermum japonicum]
LVIYFQKSDGSTAFRGCVEQCEGTGCVGDKCFRNCNFSDAISGSWYRQEPHYVEWRKWVCQSDCRYHCMIAREDERQRLGYKPHKYHRKWPSKHVHGIQEPAAVLLSGLTLAMHFHGWISFMIHVNYKLPFRPNKKPYYEYTGLWHVYAFFAMNAWFWSGAFHSRDVELTEKLDCSSAVALAGYTLFLATVRVFNLRVEAARVMVAAPIFAFAITHILYLNFYEFDHRWNTMVSMLMDAIHLTLWSVWVGVSRHPARWTLWAVILGGIPGTILMMYDFPPYWGFVDAHAIWHATMLPLTYLWWTFVRDDSEFRTLVLVNKEK